MEDETKSVECPMFYGQEVKVGWSSFDFSIVLVQNGFNGSRPVANVVLPPATAKALAKRLNTTIAQFEETHGAISVAPMAAQETPPNEGGSS